MSVAPTLMPPTVSEPATLVFSCSVSVGAVAQSFACTILNGAAMRWISLVDQSFATVQSDSWSDVTVGEGLHVAALPSSGRIAL